MIKQEEVTDSSLVPDHDDTVNDPFREIMSMMTTETIHKSALMFL